MGRFTAGSLFKPPVLWSVGFMVTFVIGGMMTSVLLAVPPVDFVVHNTVFLVAHFHNVIIGGVVFGAMAAYGVTLRFPQALRLHVARGLGQGQLLVLVPWLLPSVSAALRARAGGYAATPAAHPRCRVAPVIDRGGTWRCRHLLRHPVPDRPARTSAIRTREARRDVTGDPPGRADAGMGHRLAAPRL